MTLFRLALRSHRTGLLASALVCAIGGLINSIGFAQVAGTTPAARAIFAQQMEVLARQLTYMLPAPVELDTMAGYLAWRWFGTVVTVYVFWALLAGTGAGRGDEERGLVEIWLASTVSRARLIITRVLAFAVVSALSIVIMCAVTDVGAIISSEALPLGGLVLEGFAIWALTFAAFTLALFVSQLVTTRRAASGIAGVILLALFLTNAASRSGIDIGVTRWISPFYLYERSTPLIRGGTLDVAATAALLLVAVVVAGVAIVAFIRRDLGAALVRLAQGGGHAEWRPARDPLLRIPVLALVDQQRVWIVLWACGLAILAAFLTSITKTMVDTFASSDIPVLRLYFERLGIDAYPSFVGVIWFGTLLLLISLFVAAQVNGWAADDAEGRLDAILSAPVSRGRIVLERIAAVVAASVVLVSASSVAVYWTASSTGIVLPGGRFVLASAAVLPVAFAFAGVGHALVGWRPRLAVLAIGAVAIFGYFTQQFAPLFNWPAWVKNLSLYALYGTPLSTDDWSGIAMLTGIGVVGTILGVVTMRRRDAGR